MTRPAAWLGRAGEAPEKGAFWLQPLSSKLGVASGSLGPWVPEKSQGLKAWK